ncbi:CxC2 domain-containing protein [Favolaschia claudopus]|uniref:CxC2 domain-containing protein n=1 Tax=Favolaschia claudopus TaxID=2862362 RepID=A0AAW0AVI4_9AGAR
MHIHNPHIGQVVSVSANGRNVSAPSHEVIPDASLASSAYGEEDPQTNAAVESFDFSYDLGDTSLLAEIQGDESDGIVLTAKRKVYQNSDYPMLTWAQHQDEYLDEMIRLEGRGYSAIYSTCGGCGARDPAYRCENQLCFGPSLFCKSCIVDRHAVAPTHWIQEWNGNRFERRSLASLGLVIQLGHPVGSYCPNSAAAHKDFVVIDVTGIQHVCVNFCHCDSDLEHRRQLMRVCWWPATARDPQTCATFGVIRLFRLLNCVGKVTAHDFLRSLEFLTNNDGLTPAPDRRRAFRHIIRQYRTLLIMKRAGRGHDPSGAGMNLPDGWDKINWDTMPEDLRYKYFLFLAQDSNFRMVNRNVSSEAKDPVLHDGCGYFVNWSDYSKHLRSHVSEEEISSCSGFQAMFLANKKRIKGLRTTGIAGVTCARHNMWIANGLGPLQWGERFCNVDFVLFSGLLHFIFLYLILSYDIGCQYGKNFWARMLDLPETMHIKSDRGKVWFKVPNFHLPAHQAQCHSAYSFHYMWGAGRSHGETVEQNWEFTNGAAASTKLMGPGSWFATLEDLFAFHNWRRQVSWRDILARRMAENVKEGQAHRDAFEAFDAALKEREPEMVESWKKWVHQWESRQHTNGIESPFEVKEKVMSMRDIRLKLEKEELLRNGEGVEVEREDTPSTFLLLGLRIEDKQRHLTIDVKAVANPTEVQSLDFLKRRTALLKELRSFRKLQRQYMPNLRRFLTTTQQAVWDSEVDRQAESVRLFMPSDIVDTEKRVRACALGLPAVEASLRTGEAREALDGLRNGLRTRTMTNRFRLRHCTGQRMLTRGQGILRQVNVKIHKAKLRYQYARNALLRLKGHGVWENELRVLDDGDVRALNERVLTAEEAEQRESINDYGGVAEEGGVELFGVVAAGEGRRKLSWIWYTNRSSDPSEPELVEALRVEWCKAYARMRRWDEDVVLVEEEMRRTIEYGHAMRRIWAERARARSATVSPELLEGLEAYAAEQGARERSTSEMLTRKWGGIREKGRAFRAREIDGGVEVIVPLDDGDGPVDRDGDDEEDDD